MDEHERSVGIGITCSNCAGLLASLFWLQGWHPAHSAASDRPISKRYGSGGGGNALFAGSDGGAEHWAVIASLIETCKLNHVDPLAYLNDVLTRIVNGHPNSEIDQLLPWAYRHQDLKAVA